jgi:hypothetical protein
MILASCGKKGQTSYQSNVTGKAGELVIVISPDAWNASPGNIVKNVLGKDHVSLPQDEPIFDLINIPHEAFGDIFKTSRNLLLTNISKGVKESGIRMKRNVHAYTQAVVYVDATDYTEFVELFEKNAERITAFFLLQERDRLMLNYSNYHVKAVRAETENAFGLTINVPPGFSVAEKENDFMWIKYETPEISQGIFIYTYPYEHENTFTPDFLVAKRNVFLRKHVPGPAVGSYMSTEMDLPVVFNHFTKNGNYAAEMRGLWRVENDFMGGPFISHTILDMLDNRVVTIDAYVYAPSKDKRNLLRQLEAMIHSAKFVNQDEIDKINMQYNL